MAENREAVADTVPFKITNPERIPSKRYYDTDFYKLENEELWPRVWQMACRLAEIPEIGDFVEYRILDKSVILVRGKDEVKAFHNACRHRGVQLASGHGNCRVKGFICPFHGWRWNSEGKNTFVWGRHMFSDENLDPADLNLVPCRVEFWGGCAFINFDDDAAPLLECIAPLAKRLEHRNVDKLQIEWWTSTVLPVNWKLAMEAFMEGYHVMRTHPQLHEVSLPGTIRYSVDGGMSDGPVRPGKSAGEMVDIAISNLAILSDGMAGMCHANDVAIAQDIRNTIELPDDTPSALMKFFGTLNHEITERGRARGVPMPDLNDLAANHPAAPVQFVFPHYFMLPMFGNMSAYRIRPLGPESCLFEIWSLILFPEDEQRERPVAPEPIPYDSPLFPPIPQQDYANLPLQQLGLHSGGFDYMRLSRDIEGMISNYQRTIDGFLGGVSGKKLVGAMQLASGELDDSIVDVGF